MFLPASHNQAKNGGGGNRTRVVFPPDPLYQQILTGDELGWRLSGLADGEGCFSIIKKPGKPTHYCVFVIGLRADDRPFLELMQRSTGLGSLYDVRTTPKTLARRPGTNPQTHWRVARKADVIALAELFDRYPPLSKKAREFEIWWRAVRAWSQGDQESIAQLAIELKEARRYGV